MYLYTFCALSVAFGFDKVILSFLILPQPHKSIDNTVKKDITFKNDFCKSFTSFSFNLSVKTFCRLFFNYKSAIVTHNAFCFCLLTVFKLFDEIRFADERSAH